MKRLTLFSWLIVLTSFVAAKKEPQQSSKPSVRLGDLLITLSEIEDPSNEPGHIETKDRHELFIKGTVKNVGKKPVCGTLDARLETSKLDEFAATAFPGQDDASIRELPPGAELGVRFLASVNNGTEPLHLRISQSEPDQGCDGHRHHISKADLTIPLAGLSKIQNLSSSSGDSSGQVGEVVQVGGAVSQPRIKYQTEPEFPEEDRKARRQGTVVVRAIVGTDGRVHDPRIVRSLDRKSDQRVLAAVSQWIFDPAVKDGRKVLVYLDIEVNFRLY